MSVNNGNLRKIPLESMMNLNSFENEVDTEFSTYKKLNSPKYGGVLTNLYKKDINLNGRNFITVSPNNDIWSYVKNGSNFDIYRNDSVYMSIGNKTYTKTKGNLVSVLKALGLTDATATSLASNDKVFFKKHNDYVIVGFKSKTGTNYTLRVYSVANNTETLLGSRNSVAFPSEWQNEFGEYFISTCVLYTPYPDMKPYLFISVLPYCENASYKTVLDGRTQYTNSMFDLTSNTFVSSSNIKFSDATISETASVQFPSFTNIDTPQTDITGFSTFTTETFGIKDIIIIDGELMAIKSSCEYGLVFYSDSTALYDDGSNFYIPCHICQLSTKRLTDVPYPLGAVVDGESTSVGISGRIDAYQGSTRVKTNLTCITVQEVKEMHRTITLDPCHMSICASDDMKTTYYGNYDSTKTIDTWLQEVEFDSDNNVIPHTIAINTDSVGLQYADDYNLNWEITFAPRNKNITSPRYWYFRYFNVDTDPMRSSVYDINAIEGCIGHYQTETDENENTTIVVTNYHYPIISTPRLRTESISGSDSNGYVGNGTAIIAEGQKVGFAKSTLNSESAEQLKFTVCYFGGQFFSVGYDKMTIQNNTVLERVVSYYRNSSTRGTIILLNTDGEYVSYTLTETNTLDFTVVDSRYIFFKVFDEINAIDTKKYKTWNYALDFNNRIAMSTLLCHSILVDKSCNLYNYLYLFYLDKNPNALYPDTRKFQEGSVQVDLTEDIRSFVFTSNINNNYLITNEPYISSQVAPFIVKGLKVTKDIFKYSYRGFNAYFGPAMINMKSAPTNDEEDYANYYIDVYSTISDSSILTAITYWFSLLFRNPLIDNGTVYTLGTNVYYAPVLDSSMYNSSMNTYFTRVGTKAFQFLTNGDTKEPIFLYGLLTLTSIENIFCIQGSFYGYDENYLYYVTYSDQTIQSFDIICPINGMEFIGNNLYSAYFYSKTNRSIYTFVGDNTLNLLYECNRINNIYNVFYLTSTQDIFICSNDGVFKLSTNNTLIRIVEDIVQKIGKYENKFYFVRNGNVEVYSLNYEEEYTKVPVELETEYFGNSDFVSSIFDTVYVRLARNIEDSNKVGTISFESNVLTQINKKADKKTFKIDVSEWDNDTSTTLIRYQPKFQEGIGFSLGIKSDFPISAIYINSTPVAITNSKNNI